MQRKEQRALELEEIKKKTQRVMRTFEATATSPGTRTSLNNVVIHIDIRNIGIVFPLTLEKSVVPRSGLPLSEVGGGVPAFLFSVKSLDFVTQRYETGNAKMLGFAFQFVPRFVPPFYPVDCLSEIKPSSIVLTTPSHATFKVMPMLLITECCIQKCLPRSIRRLRRRRVESGFGRRLAGLNWIWRPHWRDTYSPLLMSID